MNPQNLEMTSPPFHPPRTPQTPNHHPFKNTTPQTPSLLQNSLSQLDSRLSPISSPHILPPQRPSRCLLCTRFTNLGWFSLINVTAFLLGAACVSLIVWVLLSNYKAKIDFLARDYHYNLNILYKIIFSTLSLASLMVLFALIGLSALCLCYRPSTRIKFVSIYLLLMALSILNLGIATYFIVTGKKDTDTWILTQITPQLQAYLNLVPQIPQPPPQNPPVDLSSINDLQSTFDCCGIQSIADYTALGIPLQWLPVCETVTVGCIPTIHSKLNQALHYTIYAVSAFGAILLVNIFSAIVLRWVTRKKLARKQTATTILFTSNQHPPPAYNYHLHTVSM